MGGKTSQIDFRQTVVTGLQKLEIQLEDDALSRLERYFVELKKWSKKMNLIAKKSSDETIIENHFLDSLTLVPLLKQHPHPHLLDVGTGAGFPGLVVRCVIPRLQLTLVEPRLKRVLFLRHILRLLQLDQVKVLECRIQDDQQIPSETQFSHITSRAVTEIGEFIEMISRFHHSDLQVICMKGPQWQQELERAAEIITGNSFSHQNTISCVLPFSGAQRNLVLLGC